MRQIGVGKDAVSASSPPAKPDGRIPRIRPSSQWAISSPCRVAFLGDLHPAFQSCQHAIRPDRRSPRQRAGRAESSSPGQVSHCPCYGLVVRLRLLPTLPRGNAVTFDYTPEHRRGEDFHLSDSNVLSIALADPPPGPT